MKVFTFFADVEDKDRVAEMALIELWSESWKRQGWQPIVLNDSSLDRDESTRTLMRHFERLPSQNRRNLDRWCYARWLAVAQQGGGFMSDYDVINYSFAPREAGALTTYDRWIPCLVSGTAAEFFRAVKWFAEEPVPIFSKLRKLHTSDMLILQRRQAEFRQLRECVEFELDGWESAPAVHFSNRGMKARALMPRHIGIQKIRPLPDDIAR